MREVCVDRWGRKWGKATELREERSDISYPTGCGQTGVDIVGQMQKKNLGRRRGQCKSEPKGEGGGGERGR